MLLATAKNNGYCLGHHCCRRTNQILTTYRGQSKLINVYIILMHLLKSFHSGLIKNIYKATNPSEVV